MSSLLFVLLQKSHLIDFGAEKLLAFELNISHIVGLRTIDADLAAELNPGNSQNTPAKKKLVKRLSYFTLALCHYWPKGKCVISMSSEVKHFKIVILK